MRPRRQIALLAAGAALAAGAVASGCGSDDSDSSPSPSAAASPSASAAASAPAKAAGKVEIADFEYAPETLMVEAGTEVRWTNSDDAAHTATGDDGSFDTGDLDRGDSASVTFDEPGSFTYYCRFHPFMKATVEVE